MVRMENTAIRIGLAAALTIGSLGLFTSTALAEGGGRWNQQQQKDNARAERKAPRPERAARQAPQQRQAPRQERQVWQQRPQQQYQKFEPRRKNAERQPSEHFRTQQQRQYQQRQQADQRRYQNGYQGDRQRVQSERVRAQQQKQRQQSDQRRHQAEQQQRQHQHNERFRAQQNQRNYAQRPDHRRPADWQNNNRHDPRWNKQPQHRNNYQYYAKGNHYRTADWTRWRNRHYVAAPRYHWSYDRYSRPWFDYNRVSYISIYRPTYVIPYNAYQSYGTSYYGPVGCNRDVVGAVLGGVAGGLIGANNGGGGATVGGAIIGALLGGTLCQMIDMNDQACYGQVLEYAPSNQPVYWENDGAQYQVTPLRTYRNGSGEYCREYQTYVYIDGREQQAYGTACRQPDGAWRAS